MAKLITISGATIDVSPKDGKRFSLEELQGFVGGYIDFVNFPSGQVACINDNGKLEGLPINEVGSSIFKKEFPIEKYPENNDGILVGDILILSAEENEAQEKYEE